MNFGDKPTIFADLTCAACGRNIEDAAGKKLVELFADARIPPENRKVFFLFALGALAAPVVLLIPAIVTGIALLYLLPVIALTFILPSILLLNYRIASIRNRCECGKPEFLFMGLLGRAYCYRCSCCGRLLKLRD
ncbi:MAG: hypothetical protein JXA49_00340 [Actinobacteria bacterium]|nr:hypothetical protein [Actinomycetota bacterium]